MRRVHAFALAALLAGCTDKPSDTSDTGTTGPEEGTFEFFVDVADAPIGDLACFTGGDWLTQTVDTAKQVAETRTELVEDFSEELPVYESSVDFWFADAAVGTPDLTVESDNSGMVTFTVDACTPTSYRAFTPPALDETKDTYEAHQVFTPLAAAEEFPFNSVSKSTYLLIPNLLGILPDESRGNVAGTVFDCNGDPVEGAQVVPKDASGNIPTGTFARYFVERFPNREQQYTNDDGLFVIINIPVGTWTVEAYVSDGAGGHTLVGATVLESYADSINISNITVGYGDGIFYPDACL